MKSNQKGIAPVIMILIAVAVVGTTVVVANSKPGKAFIKNLEHGKISFSDQKETNPQSTLPVPTPTATSVATATPKSTSKPTSSTSTSVKAPTVAVTAFGYKITIRPGESVMTGIFRSDTVEAGFKVTANVTSLSFPQADGMPAGVSWSYKIVSNGAAPYLNVGAGVPVGTYKWKQKSYTTKTPVNGEPSYTRDITLDIELVVIP